MDLKQKLLKTGLFIDNDKLAKYITLIENNKSSIDDSSQYKEKHHIIPKSYFKLIAEPIDNSVDNIVKLTYFDHVLAHYYLSLCTLGKLHQANVKAFIMLIDIGQSVLTLPELDAIRKIKDYVLLHNEAIELKKTTCKILGQQKKSIAHRQALKQARDLHATTKNKKAIYNKQLNKVKFISLDQLDSYLQTGWVLGGKPLTEEAKKKIGIGNSQALKGKKHQARQSGKLGSGLEPNAVKCLETGTIFKNIKEAELWLTKTVGIDGGQIKNCCAGKRDTTGGYHWAYIKKDKEIDNK